MTVAELIEHLRTSFPQSALVCYNKFSEQCLLEPEELELKAYCAPRADGWVHDGRPDQPAVLYVNFPGN